MGKHFPRRPHTGVLSFSSDRTPVGHFVGKSYLAEPCASQHFFNLLPRKSLLEPGTKPVVGIGAHYIEVSMTVGFERNGGRRESGTLDQRCKTCERPVDDNRDDLADGEPQSWRQQRDDDPKDVAETPDCAIPPRAVV